jgi:hypothetical protein
MVTDSFRTGRDSEYFSLNRVQRIDLHRYDTQPIEKGAAEAAPLNVTKSIGS